MFGYPMWIVGDQAPPEDDEDLALGYSMMRALAEAGAGIEEIGPGVWRHSGEGVTWVPFQDGCPRTAPPWQEPRHVATGVL